MGTGYHDGNHTPTLVAVSSADNKTPVNVWADPTKHALLTVADPGVVGPGSSTDNAVVRWDGTTGATLQNSTVIIGDTGDITGVGSITATSYTVGASAGASGSFTTVDLKTVTVVNGIITSIV